MKVLFKRIFLSLIIHLILHTATFCDDAHLDLASGVARLMGGASTSVQMDSELVIIELGKDNFTVDATFWFFNKSKTVTLQVGFPKLGYGPSPSSGDSIIAKNFIKFETWVNDEIVSWTEFPGEIKYQNWDGKIKTVKNKNYSDVLASIETEEAFEDSEYVVYPHWISEIRWLVKEVTFYKRTKTATRVKFTAPYTYWSEDIKSLGYLYGTGHSWKDKIGKAKFVVRFSDEAWLKGCGYYCWTTDILWVNTDDYKEKCPRRNIRINQNTLYEYEYIFTDFEPNEDEIFIVWVGEDYYSFIENLEFEYDQRIISDSMLFNLSPHQLRIFRNMFFARHGKIFQSPDLRELFNIFEWYQPREDFHENVLNDIEKENIKKILKREKEFDEFKKKLNK